MEKYKAGRFLFWGYMLWKYQGENLRLDSPCPSGLCHMTLSRVGFLTLAPGTGENSHFLKRRMDHETTLAFQGIVWGFISYLAYGSEPWCDQQFGFLVGTTEKHSKHPAFYGYTEIFWGFHSSDLSALVFHSCVNMKFPVDVWCWVSLQVLLYHLQYLLWWGISLHLLLIFK